MEVKTKGKIAVFYFFFFCSHAIMFALIFQKYLCGGEEKAAPISGSDQRGAAAPSAAPSFVKPESSIFACKFSTNRSQ